MSLESLEEIIQLAESDLQKFEARYSGYPNNDSHIEKSKTIICGAKKLLKQLKSVDKDLGAD